MQSFQVLSGKHYEKTAGRKIIPYKKGDIVKSLRDLRKLFPNKFDLVESAVREEAKPPFTVMSLGKGRYNVTNTLSNDTINEEPLTKSEAEQLVRDQTKEID